MVALDEPKNKSWTPRTKLRGGDGVRVDMGRLEQGLKGETQDSGNGVKKLGEAQL